MLAFMTANAQALAASCTEMCVQQVWTACLACIADDPELLQRRGLAATAEPTTAPGRPTLEDGLELVLPAGGRPPALHTMDARPAAKPAFGAAAATREEPALPANAFNLGAAKAAHEGPFADVLPDTAGPLNGLLSELLAPVRGSQKPSCGPAGAPAPPPGLAPAAAELEDGPQLALPPVVEDGPPAEAPASACAEAWPEQPKAAEWDGLQPALQAAAVAPPSASAEERPEQPGGAVQDGLQLVPPAAAEAQTAAISDARSEQPGGKPPADAALEAPATASAEAALNESAELAVEPLPLADSCPELSSPAEGGAALLAGPPQRLSALAAEEDSVEGPPPAGSPALCGLERRLSREQPWALAEVAAGEEAAAGKEAPARAASPRSPRADAPRSPLAQALAVSVSSSSSPRAWEVSSVIADSSGSSPCFAASAASRSRARSGLEGEQAAGDAALWEAADAAYVHASSSSAQSMLVTGTTVRDPWVADSLGMDCDYNVRVELEALQRTMAMLAGQLDALREEADAAAAGREPGPQAAGHAGHAGSVEGGVAEQESPVFEAAGASLSLLVRQYVRRVTFRAAEEDCSWHVHQAADGCEADLLAERRAFEELLNEVVGTAAVMLDQRDHFLRLGTAGKGHCALLSPDSSLHLTAACN